MSGERECFSNYRDSELRDYEHGGQRWTVGFSRFVDGRIGEIFINSRGKSGSAAEVSAKDGAIMCSFALQHGADINALRRALMRNANGCASGPLGAALDLLVE
jgi:hypothetical protein